MKSYLALNEFFDIFSRSSNECDIYFNICDFEIYDEYQMREIIKDYDLKNNFLSIPSMPYKEIIVKFIENRNKRDELYLLRKQNRDDFGRIFHRFVENNELSIEWYNFYKNELIAFGEEWCNNNNIKCSK